MYKVIRYFRDAQDNDYAYNVGDVFPHEGMTVSQHRIIDLMNGNNFQQVPLIEYAPDKKKVVEEKSEPENLTREMVEKMPFFKLKSVAKEYGIDVKEKKADEIKAELMEKL